MTRDSHKKWQRVHRYGMPEDGLPEKKCPGCGVIFKPVTRRQIFHNKACGVAYKYLLKRQQTAENKRLRLLKFKAIPKDGMLLIPLSGRAKGRHAIVDDTQENRDKIEGSVFCLDHYGYPVDSNGNKLHHIIFKKPSSDKVIDHINGNKLDNRYANLREVPRGLNNYNQGRRSHNTSGATGVSRCSSKNGSERWEAYISKDKQFIRLGHYKTFNEALKARKIAEIKLYSEPSEKRNGSKSSVL